MFNDEILDKIFARKEIQKLTVAEQSELVHALIAILEEEDDNESGNT